MRLIGRYASPFVRRVAVTMQIYGIPYEHVSMMPFGESREALAEYNPIARVPVLELDDGEKLIDSAAILDHLDASVGPERALIPATGAARRRVLSHLAITLGVMDKLVAVLYERHFRPQEKWHKPWIAACEEQVRDGFVWLDGQFEGDWLSGGTMSQADVSLAVFWSFGCAKRPGFFSRLDCPRIAELADRLEATEPFRQTPRETETLSTDLSTTA
ncbi:MAG: glutathione S-transferase family protein [Alphaproteobacteria bacterium]|nr:glutathione S-transferase family protein [Alphaproteobacteria bacterium]